MKLAVIGSRDFTNYAEMRDALDKIAQHIDIDLIISGRARGADLLAERYAKERNIQTLIFPADWEKHGRKAGIVRNYDIIRNCDMVVAFWDGKSKGTAHSISVAREQKKKVLIYRFYKET